MGKKKREQRLKYIKHKDFNEERANKASKVAGPLVKWVKSQLKYSELLDIVRPMLKELKFCCDVVNKLEVKISKARQEINEMVENMIKMQDKYDLYHKDDPLLDVAKGLAQYKNISL